MKPQTEAVHTPEITYLRRRGNKFYFLVDGQKVRVDLTGSMPTYAFNYDKPAQDLGPTFTVGYDSLIYRDSDRKWHEAVGSFFYPYASEQEAVVINGMNEIINTLGRKKK